MKNLNAPHTSEPQRQAILAAIEQLKTLLLPLLFQLSPDERQRYGAVNEQNKLFLNKVAEFKETQPNLSAPQIDWTKYSADYNDRDFFSDLIMLMQSLIYDVQSTKIAHDHDNANAARIDYAYAEFLAKSDVMGAVQKYNVLKQFFKHASLPKEEEEKNEDDKNEGIENEKPNTDDNIAK